MAKKFLTPLDMTGLEIQNFRVQNNNGVPTTNVSEGRLIFNSSSSSKKLTYYNGTQWVELDAGAPTSHASSATTYGTGTSSNYGHVKLSDSTSSTSSTSDGTAATPAAVKAAYDLANGKQDLIIIDTSISSSSTDSDIPSSKAVYDYVGSAISAADAMVFKGGIAGTSTSPGAFTPAADCGHTYRVTTAGYIDGINVEIGDILICNTDSTAQATSSNYTTVRNNWTFIQANLDGAVTGSGTSGYLTKWNGTGTVTNGPQLGNSITTFLRNDGNWAVPDNTDTKNTAGATDTSSKIFLIGATSQDTNPQTYSQDSAYVGSDGYLYSGSTKVSTTDMAHTELTLTAGKTILNATSIIGYYPTWDAYLVTSGTFGNVNGKWESIELDYESTRPSGTSILGHTWSIASAVSSPIVIVCHAPSNITISKTSES